MSPGVAPWGNDGGLGGPPNLQGRRFFLRHMDEILDMEGVGGLLKAPKATVERWIAKDGLPYLDLGHHDPRRRPRRLLRFSREQVVRWALERGANGNGSREQK
jgi:hypothetical protein